MASDSPCPPSRSLGPDWIRAGKNAAWLVAEKLGRGAVAFFIGTSIARHLGPEQFGSMSTALSWVGLFAATAGFGVEPVVVRELVHNPHRAATILSTALRLRAGINLTLTGLCLGAALVFPTLAPDLPLTAIASLAMLFTFGDTFDLWFQSTLGARRAAAGRALAFAAACAVRIVLLLSDAPASAFLWTAAGEAMLVSLVLARLSRETRALATPASIPLLREMIAECWPSALANLAAASYLRADRVMLAAFRGNAEAGLYSAAANPIDMLYFLPSVIVSSAAPMLAMTFARDREAFMNELGRVARVSALLGWLAALGILAGAFWFIPLLYGEAFAPAAPTMAVLALSMPFAFMGVAASPWYQNTRLTRLALRRHVFGAVLHLLLNLLLIPRWGAPGAAAATVIAFATAHVLTNGLDARTRPLLYLQGRALALLPFSSHANHRSPDRSG